MLFKGVLRHHSQPNFNVLSNLTSVAIFQIVTSTGHKCLMLNLNNQHRAT